MLLFEAGHYWVEFLTIATVHLLAVASPGPDFAIVMRYSLSVSRRAAVLASVGIGLGILVHVAYSLLGIGLLIKSSATVFWLFKIAAAGYLFYIGIMAIRFAKPVAGEQQQVERPLSVSDRQAFTSGLITNGLNPKATLFFLSVFAVVVSVNTPTQVKLVYGVYMAIATTAWFTLVATLLSTETIRSAIYRQGHWFERLMGAVLIGLALHLLLSDLS